ncbi:hypothetical protein P152DRAFT_458670, partial [Eremomyces bilateralis CBS 781.70]
MSAGKKNDLPGYEDGKLGAESVWDKKHPTPPCKPPPEYLAWSSTAGPVTPGGTSPDEIVLVPFFHTVQKRTIKDFLTGRRVYETKISAREMKRSHYDRHYATDSDGKYIGTGKAAIDAPMVYVPTKSTPEYIQEQLNKVAFGKEHRFVTTQVGETGYA